MEGFLESIRLISCDLERYWIESTSGSTRVVDQLPMRDIISRLDLKTHLQTRGLAGDALVKFASSILVLQSVFIIPAVWPIKSRFLIMLRL